MSSRRRDDIYHYLLAATGTLTILMKKINIRPWIHLSVEYGAKPGKETSEGRTVLMYKGVDMPDMDASRPGNYRPDLSSTKYWIKLKISGLHKAGLVYCTYRGVWWPWITFLRSLHGVVDFIQEMTTSNSVDNYNLHSCVSGLEIHIEK